MAKVGLAKTSKIDIELRLIEEAIVIMEEEVLILINEERGEEEMAANRITRTTVVKIPTSLNSMETAITATSMVTKQPIATASISASEKILH